MRSCQLVRATHSGGITDISPDSPLKQVNSVSAKVGPITVFIEPGSFHASSNSHSAPTRVLPKPRPASTRALVQRPPRSIT